MRESFGGRWELLLSLPDRVPPAPLSSPVDGWEYGVGEADRETGRKPQWGSIVL